MLLVGLPLTILLGTVAAWLLFDSIGIWEAALLAAILAPTDAALGQAVVTNPLVPARIRQTLNVESGLNDGIALPFVLIFAALASAANTQTDAAEWLLFGATQVLLGPEDGMPNFAMRRFVMGEGGGMPLHTNTVEHEQYVLAGRARISIGDQLYDVAAGSERTNSA